MLFWCFGEEIALFQPDEEGYFFKIQFHRRHKQPCVTETDLKMRSFHKIVAMGRFLPSAPVNHEFVLVVSDRP